MDNRLFLSKTLSQTEKKPLSRFENCQELTQLHPILKQLRLKQRELKKDGDLKGVGSLDARKCIVITKLLSDLDAAVGEFDKKAVQKNHHDEVKEIIKLVHDLAMVIRDCAESFQTTLMAPRNDKRKTVNTAKSFAVDVGTYGVTGLTILNWPVGIVGSLFALFYVAPAVNDKAREKLGLNTTTFLTATMQLLEEFSVTLVSIGENLGLAKSWDKKLASPDKGIIPDEFICPIFGTLMIKPTHCNLDSRSYEEGAIVKWLSEHGTAPFNRKPLKPGQHVEDVLSMDINLRDAIERFRLDNPRLLDGELQQNNIKLGQRTF